jgi:hypothetical protein
VAVVRVHGSLYDIESAVTGRVGVPTDGQLHVVVSLRERIVFPAAREDPIF